MRRLIFFLASTFAVYAFIGSMPLAAVWALFVTAVVLWDSSSR